eukprot:s2174_g9.t1
MFKISSPSRQPSIFEPYPYQIISALTSKMADSGVTERERMLAAYVGEGVLPTKNTWPVFTKEQDRIHLPIADYALAGISCAAVHSRRAGGSGPEAPAEPKVRLARVGFGETPSTNAKPTR